MAIGILNIAIDFLDQFFHAAEGSPAYGLLRDAIEPDLHLIEPGGIGGSKVHMKSWSRGEPAPNSAMLMRGVIIPTMMCASKFFGTFFSISRRKLRYS